MPKHAARADANQPEIVDILRTFGYLVAHTHTLGRGLPDIIVSGYHHGHRARALLWVEIKTPGGTFTSDEDKFLLKWEKEPVIVARSITDILEWFEDDRITAANSAS